MKKVFLSLVLILLTILGKSQNFIEVKVDSMFLFEFSDTLTFEDAWYNDKVTNLGIVREYREDFKIWLIDKSTQQITFGSTEPLPYVLKNDKLEYLTSKGNTFKLFFKKDKNTGQDIVFFLENSKNGKIKGGFTYPEYMIKY